MFEYKTHSNHNKIISRYNFLSACDLISATKYKRKKEQKNETEIQTKQAKKKKHFPRKSKNINNKKATIGKPKKKKIQMRAKKENNSR